MTFRRRFLSPPATGSTFGREHTQHPQRARHTQDIIGARGSRHVRSHRSLLKGTARGRASNAPNASISKGTRSNVHRSYRLPSQRKRATSSPQRFAQGRVQEAPGASYCSRYSAGRRNHPGYSPPRRSACDTLYLVQPIPRTTIPCFRRHDLLARLDLNSVGLRSGKEVCGR